MARSFLFTLRWLLFVIKKKNDFLPTCSRSVGVMMTSHRRALSQGYSHDSETVGRGPTDPTTCCCNGFYGEFVTVGAIRSFEKSFESIRSSVYLPPVEDVGNQVKMFLSTKVSIFLEWLYVKNNLPSKRGPVRSNTLKENVLMASPWQSKLERSDPTKRLWLQSK